VKDLTVEEPEQTLAGRRVLLVGRLASMPRREAERVVRERGGVLVERGDGEADLVVVNDETCDPKRLTTDSEQLSEELRERIGRGEVELLGESEFLARLGLVEAGPGIERLYTPAMLAELVGVPIGAVRQWQRNGTLVARREVRRLPYFDFQEVGVARKLAALLSAGCSLATVNRKLAELVRLLPELPRPLADPAVVVEGRRLFVRRDEGLAEPNGQLLLEFDVAKTPAEVGAASMIIPFEGRRELPGAPEELRALAAELESSGQTEQAIEVYRAVLFSGEATADDHFAIAELLYLRGDLLAARERYYMAIELDEDFVEARSNLGCVLAESGEMALAEAAFRGALEYHPDYADAHYHLAHLLDRLTRGAEAARHWRLFMSLAPASPWADEAKERIEAEGCRRSPVGHRQETGTMPEGLADSR
jgi:tetratricopeptide (TPR) repeat protein